MTSPSVKRVLDVIGHRRPDRIPTGELVMDRAFMESLLAWCGEGGAGMSDLQLTIASGHLLGHDLVCQQSEPPGVPNVDVLSQAAGIRPLADAGFFVFWIVGGPFQRAMAAGDFMAFMKAVATAPASLLADLDKAADKGVDALTLGIRHGAHGVIIADDIAYQKNSYISPDFGRRHLLPLWQRQVHAARGLGVPAFFHSDGNINRFLPLIVAAGFDGLQCIEPAADMDIHAIARQHGDRLCLMGNIDPALLCGADRLTGMPAEHPSLGVAVTTLVRAFGDTGGLILGTASGLHGGMSPERVCRMAALAGAS